MNKPKIILAVLLSAFSLSSAAHSISDCLHGRSNSSACRAVLVNYWKHDQAIHRAAVNNGIPPSMFRSLVGQESGYNQHARSHVGAYGLTQIMPGTAPSLGVRYQHLHHPEVALNAGAAFLRQLCNRFGRWDLALAAYNSGPNRVARLGRVPNIPETQKYVRNILALERSFRAKSLGVSVHSLPLASSCDNRAQAVRAVYRHQAAPLPAITTPNAPQKAEMRLIRDQAPASPFRVLVSQADAAGTHPDLMTESEARADVAAKVQALMREGGEHTARAAQALTQVEPPKPQGNFVPLPKPERENRTLPVYTQSGWVEGSRLAQSNRSRNIQAAVRQNARRAGSRSSVRHRQAEPKPAAASNRFYTVVAE